MNSGASPPGVDAIPAERIAIRPGFRWDCCDAYLFDIDGTLLHAGGGVHYDAFSSSVQKVMGYALSIGAVRVAGNTDIGILRDAFQQAEIAETEWQPRLDEILQRLRATVLEQRERMKVTVLPGVEEVLRYLRSQGKALGVATGNLEEIGWLKVELAGLRDWFSFGGFSDLHMERAALIGSAVLGARRVAGSHATVCVVGDTPWDIAAARANSLPTIAVATGIYSYDALLQHAPEVCTNSLSTLLKSSVVGLKSSAVG